MRDFVQILVLGTAIGGLYALMGVGLNLIFGVMRVANMAHGALYLIGGYVAYLAARQWHLPLPLAILAAVAVSAAAGYGLNAYLLRPLYGRRIERPSEFALIVTFALSLVVSSGATILFSSDYQRFDGFWPVDLNLGGWVLISGDRLIALGFAQALIGGLLWLVRFSDVGRGWRALTQNRAGAEVVGIDVMRLSNLAFATSGALAGAAGAILVPVYLAYPSMGSSALVKSFVVVILGGLGSITGSLVAGFLLAWAEVFGSIYLDAAYSDLYGFAIMILVLLLRPNGLLGRMGRVV
jgi:branched-chain amino acid transport system permease protein